MESIEIRSFESIGPLRFGMSPPQVHALIGRPYGTIRDAQGCTHDGFASLGATYGPGGSGLVQVAVAATYDAVFREVHLFTDPAVLDHLVAMDGAPLQAEGVVVFHALGIALVGFDGSSDRSVLAFTRGYWREHRQLIPYVHKPSACKA